MTDLRKAANMALRALEFSYPLIEDYGNKEQLDIHHEAIMALHKALAQPEPEPFKPDWVSYRQGVADGAAQSDNQEPVHFLANGVRYKVTHQGYYGCSIVGLPENLNGQWVALVEATDSKHLNCIAPQESTKPEQEPVAKDKNK